jgi:hypothetical protein
VCAVAVGVNFHIEKINGTALCSTPDKISGPDRRKFRHGSPETVGVSGPSLSGIDRSTGFDKSAYSVLLSRTTVVIILLFKLKRQKSYNPLFNTEK